MLAYPLPDSLRLIGVAALDSARILGWTSDRVVLLNAFRQHAPQVLRNSWPVLAARVEADSSIEVVDAAGVRRHNLLSGAFTRTVTFPDGIRYLNAARSGLGWVIGGVDESGTYLLMHVRPREVPTVLMTILPDTLRGGKVPAYQLSSSAEGVLLSEAELPFRTWRVRWDGSVLPPFAPRLSTLPKGEGDDVRWVALPVVQVGAGYLQTLADLASDRRALVTFDSSGSQIRVGSVPVPVGIVGRSEDGRYLVAARDAGGQEVVLYRWRWRAGTSTRGGAP